MAVNDPTRSLSLSLQNRSSSSRRPSTISDNVKMEMGRKQERDQVSTSPKTNESNSQASTSRPSEQGLNRRNPKRRASGDHDDSGTYSSDFRFGDIQAELQRISSQMDQNLKDAERSSNRRFGEVMVGVLKGFKVSSMFSLFGNPLA